MEKTLSDWIVEKDVIGQDKKIGYIHKGAVKEFIRLLKNEIKKMLDEDSHEELDFIINKIAGDKLI